jgi:hypothetical protein
MSALTKVVNELKYKVLSLRERMAEGQLRAG